MNRAYIFYGWKVDADLALRFLEEETVDLTDWFFTEIDEHVFLTHACPANGLNLFECDFYVIMNLPCGLPIDPDALFDLLRDRNLLERAWRACRRVCNLPSNVSFTPPEVHAVVHFY